MVAGVENRVTQAGVNVFATVVTDMRLTQGFALTAATTAVDMRLTQSGLLTATTSSIDMRMTQSAVLVAVSFTPLIPANGTGIYPPSGAGYSTLRSWTFTQDDHDFYVMQIGNGTYIYDKSTEQWCKWQSSNVTYWDASDGCDWQGINVCCSSGTGDIYKIDADGRLDLGTTPIVSVIYGGMTERFRTFAPCYMAEVAVSQARPPAGIAAGLVGIGLRTYDTLSWTDHGSIAGLGSGVPLTIRFYGLGLMKPPGVIFEITDTGYARRIDGLNIETGGQGG